jgi:hypothetical protein
MNYFRQASMTQNCMLYAVAKSSGYAVHAAARLLLLGCPAAEGTKEMALIGFQEDTK